MKYILHNKSVVVKSEKQWLTRNKYSKDAVKVLGRFCKDVVPSDVDMYTSLKMSKNRYQEAKRELVFCGLLEVHKINSTTLVYLVGESAITKFHEANEDRELRRVNRLALESVGLALEKEVEPIDTEVHSEVQYENSTVTKPTAIDIKEEDIL